MQFRLLCLEAAVPLLAHCALHCRECGEGSVSSSALGDPRRVLGARHVSSCSDRSWAAHLCIWIRLRCSCCALMRNVFPSSLKFLGIVFDTKSFLNHLEWHLGASRRKRPRELSYWKNSWVLLPTAIDETLKNADLDFDSDTNQKNPNWNCKPLEPWCWIWVHAGPVWTGRWMPGCHWGGKGKSTTEQVQEARWRSLWALSMPFWQHKEALQHFCFWTF